MPSVLFFLAMGILLGSIPTAVWISKKFYGFDIRTKGSLNAGLTNTYRVLGWRAAAPVAIVDSAKGFLAASLAYYGNTPLIDPMNLSLLTGAAAIIGHSFTFLAGFRGGKGILTGLGVFLFLVPLSALSCLLFWILVLYLTGYASLASILSTLALATVISFQWLSGGLSFAFVLVTWGMFLFVFYRHRENLVRLWSGTESRFPTRKFSNKPKEFMK